MTDELNITIDWERLEEGPVEERACFGLLTFRQSSLTLTEGLDSFVEWSRPGPLVSGYPLADWMAWNWWRLTGEPKPQRPTEGWEFAHHLSTVGDGYVWPNITIYSDRERTILIAKPTRPQGFAAFRFTADGTVVLPTRQFEAAVDRFMGQIQGQLRATLVPATNFDRIWEEVRAERNDPETAVRRRLEALLGFDPDEGSPDVVENLLADAAQLGQDAVQEIAADHPCGGRIPSAADLAALVKERGSEICLVDMVRLSPAKLSPRDQVPAWRRGYEAVRALREQQGFGLDPLSNQRLAELCGVSATVVERSERADFAFSMDDESGKGGHIVLRSKWETNRRFDLARLLGDRLTNGLNERLLPATRTSTYRQKLQRAFAAELLCPFEALEDQLAGDYSNDAMDDAAHHFNVSERTVTTLLVNHRRLDRDFLEGDPEALAA